MAYSSYRFYEGVWGQRLGGTYHVEGFQPIALILVLWYNSFRWTDRTRLPC